MKVTAAVLEKLGSDFAVKELDLADPGQGEVLIEVAGVGLCHTDLAVAHGHLPFPFPAVVGHEGSGVVTAVGEGVTKVAPGDRVAATFNSCGICSECAAGSPSYCVRFMELNFSGVAATARRPCTTVPPTWAATSSASRRSPPTRWPTRPTS
nr:alcohol dehydrogenase catalytic domain-containing protein [Protofrankia symbiont of Coriaria ruscifolia]